MTLLVLLGVLLGSAWLARKNLRAGRGDRRGALRLSAVTAVVATTMALASSDFPLDLGGVFGGAMYAIQQALLWAGATWLLYLAVEPSIRRSRPELLVSWSRAVAGELRDPLGRDLLIGSLAGLTMAGAISPSAQGLDAIPWKPQSLLCEPRPSIRLPTPWRWSCKIC